jgi:isocitrate dehydrogenase
MAQKAEEYGSHDKTFEIEAAGSVRVVDGSGDTLLEHDVEPGDIWRGCQTKDAAVATGCGSRSSAPARPGAPPCSGSTRAARTTPRSSRRSSARSPARTPDDLQIETLPVAEAARFTLERAKNGEDTISVTGNVLRDYLTDLFPILELGTSAKMLSIVPLIDGGGLFETGAGGSAPKHVQQFTKENHLRWDSLGEFLALARRSSSWPARPKTRWRCSARRWTGPPGSCSRTARRRRARSGARQSREPLLPRALLGAGARRADRGRELAQAFAPLAERLAADEETIVAELNGVQGEPVDLGGYYWSTATRRRRRCGRARRSTTRSRRSSHDREPSAGTSAASF